MTDQPALTAPDRCPIARSLEFIGERWTILIIRDLNRFGPRKFQDFEQGLAGIGPNTLSARLKKLEDAGIVERRFYEQHPPRAEYLLTAAGKELRPVLKALLAWGRCHTVYLPATPPPDARIKGARSGGMTGRRKRLKAGRIGSGGAVPTSRREGPPTAS